jgi:hypothetical protein
VRHSGRLAQTVGAQAGGRGPARSVPVLGPASAAQHPARDDAGPTGRCGVPSSGQRMSVQGRNLKIHAPFADTSRGSPRIPTLRCRSSPSNTKSAVSVSTDGPDDPITDPASRESAFERLVLLTRWSSCCRCRWPTMPTRAARATSWASAFTALAARCAPRIGCKNGRIPGRTEHRAMPRRCRAAAM